MGVFWSHAGPANRRRNSNRSTEASGLANRHGDQTVRSQCLAVDAKLAEVLEGDNPTLRQVLANSVKQLEEALRWAARSTIEKATFHFLTGLRRRGSLSA